MTNNGKGTVDVTVILPTYNRNAVLRKTIECLLKQDPAAKEILVIDQTRNHDDETKAFLESMQSNQGVRYIFQSEPNAQRARNLGIAESTGEVLLFVDDDVEMDSSLIEAHWRNYSDPEIGAVCGFYLEPGEHPMDELPDSCLKPLTGWIQTPHAYTKRFDSYLLSTCNGSVRRDIAVRLGGFDENFTHTLLDDTDFSCRLKELGVKSVHDPEARLMHLKEPSGGKRPGKKNQYAIADSNLWYTWFYFFGSNFGWSGWREIAIRLRRTVFRKANIIRPWYLVQAMMFVIQGALRARSAMRKGRKLGLNRILTTDQPSLNAVESAQSDRRIEFKL
jgi:GT2 family glycosyltransferase